MLWLEHTFPEEFADLNPGARELLSTTAPQIRLWGGWTRVGKGPRVHFRFCHIRGRFSQVGTAGSISPGVGDLTRIITNQQSITVIRKACGMIGERASNPRSRRLPGASPDSRPSPPLARRRHGKDLEVKVCNATERMLKDPGPSTWNDGSLWASQSGLGRRKLHRKCAHLRRGIGSRPANWDCCSVMVCPDCICRATIRHRLKCVIPLRCPAQRNQADGYGIWPWR